MGRKKKTDQAQLSGDTELSSSLKISMPDCHTKQNGNINEFAPLNAPLFHRVSKEELQAAIYECCGMTTMLCQKYDCNYRQLYNAFDKFDLRGDLDKAREQFQDKAKTVIFNTMDSEDEGLRLRAAEAALKHSCPGNQVNINTGTNPVDIKSIFFG